MNFIKLSLQTNFLNQLQEIFCYKLFLPSVISVTNLCSASESDKVLEAKMVTPKRYFINDMPDYKDNQLFCLQRDILREQMVQIIQQIETKQPAVGKSGDGGLYVGISGIAYMFYHLSKSPIFSDKKDDFLSKGLEYIKASEKCQSRRSVGDPADTTGFLLGGSGIHAVAACLFQCTGNRKAMESSLAQFNLASKVCKPIHFLSYGGDEFLVGRAGYLAGALWLNNHFKENVVPIETLVAICKSMYDSGVEYSKHHRSLSPLMYSYYDTEYLGAAHGLCTILQMLMSVPEFLQQYPESLSVIRCSVDFMLSLQTDEGNFPCAMDEIGRRARPIDEDLVHWCHGAPGVVYLMAKAYLLWKDEKYLDSCIKCGDVTWKKGLLKKGPGICHGVAGSGYVFLLLYRLTNDKSYLYKAEQFANFIFTKEFKKSARTPDCPFSLYEGLAGTICYLNDVLMPDTAAFPFLDVFIESKTSHNV